MGSQSWNSSTSRWVKDRRSLSAAPSARASSASSRSSKSMAPRSSSSVLYASQAARSASLSVWGRPFFSMDTARSSPSGDMASPAAISARARLSDWSSRHTPGWFFRLMAWKVPTVRPRRARLPPSTCSSLCRSSSAARLVKVTAVMFPALTPQSSIRWAIRQARVRVFPVPGPADTATVRPSASTAARWASLSPAAAAACLCSLSPAACFTGRDFFSFTFFLAGTAVPNRLTCPLRASRSASVSRPILPYTPS